MNRRRRAEQVRKENKLRQRKHGESSLYDCPRTQQSLTQALDDIHMSEALRSKTLTAMKLQKQQRVSRESVFRYAAVAAACAVFIIGGFIMFSFMFGGDDTPAPLTSPPEISPSETPFTPFTPFTAFVPFDVPEPIEYRIICGDYVSTGEMPGRSPQVFENAEALSDFINTYNITEGQAVNRSQNPSCGLPETVDFSKKSVVAACGWDSSSPVYLPPAVFTERGYLSISCRTEPYEAATADVVLRGYFLVVDREWLEALPGDREYANGMQQYDNPEEYSNVTPSNINGAELYLPQAGFQFLSVVPDEGVVRTLGTGDGVEVFNSADSGYFVYLFGDFGAPQKRQFGIFSLKANETIYYSNGIYDYDGGMYIKEAEGGKLAIYQGETLIAYMTAESGGARFEILDERAIELLLPEGKWVDETEYDPDAGLLAYFNDEFFNGEELNIHNMFLSVLYESPEQIDLFELFYVFSEIGDFLPTEEEREALAVFYGEIEPDCPCGKIRRSTMETILFENTGLTLSETDKIGLEKFWYLEEYDAYYNYHGDTNYGWVGVDVCEREGDLLRLFYRTTSTGAVDRVLTLRDLGGGNYHFVSNKKTSPDPFFKPADIVMLNYKDPAPYTPEVSVFPLTNTAMVYKTCMVGETIFMDKNLNPVALAYEPLRYAAISDEYGVKAYAIGLPVDGGDYYSWRLMLTDGTIPLDSDGEPYLLINNGEDGPHFWSIGSTVIICRSSEQNGQLYGLYDLETRREALPCEYVQLHQAEKGIYYANKNGEGYLLDSKGKKVHSMGSIPGSAWWYEFTYVIDTENHALYNAYDIAPYDRFERFGELYLVFQYGDPNVVTVTDLRGYAICEFRYGGNGSYLIKGDYLTVLTPEGFEVLNKNGELKRFPLEYGKVVPDYYFYEGGKVYYQLGTMQPDYYFSVNEAGGVGKAALYGTAAPVEYDTETGSYILRDSEGKVLLETENELWLRGNFILESVPRKLIGSDPKAVYSLGGKRLLDNVLGWISEVPAPGGGIFVYLDENTCVLLNPDGSIIDVPSAPVVEKVYYGG